MRGRYIRTIVPSPFLDKILRQPRCALTIDWVMERLRPIFSPDCLVVKKGSNI